MTTTRRLAAILAADVAGYSRLMAADEVGTLEALKACRREIVDPAIAEHKGRIVKTTGDGMLVEFASAVDAVTCAMAVQGAMAARGDSLTFRIGINVGDIIIDGDDIFGDGVNVAARVENECEPGNVCLSANAVEQIRNKTTFAFDDLGEKSLKNIDRPIRIYGVRVATGAPAGIAWSEPGKPLPLPLPDKPSIAVLPFQNMSGDPEQEYFADGMVEDIITALSRFKSLFVIARNSSFTYKGKAVDIKQVGRELGVRYVLEGSVRKSGGRVRITGQLIEAETGAHLWAEKFDGAAEEVFDLQDKVTSSVAGVIAPRIERAEIEKALRKSTQNLAAYDYYLKGIAYHHRWSKADSDHSLQMFSNAVELDATFAMALQWTSACYGQRLLQGWMDDREKEVAEALRLTSLSLRIDRDDAFVLTSAAFTLYYFSDDLESAGSLADRAVELNPNFALAWTASAWIRMCLGDHAAAITHHLKALQLSPVDAFNFTMMSGLARCYFYLNHLEDARHWAERTIAANTNYIPGLRCLAAIEATAGRIEKARAMVQRIREIDPGHTISASISIRQLRRPEDKQKYADALRLAGLPETN